jgi:hypothetical protein
MRRISNRIATPLFALMFAASLAFGVTSSFAQVARLAPVAAACPDDGFISAGPCISPEHCDERCRRRGFIGGDCIVGPEGNCCVCQG